MIPLNVVPSYSNGIVERYRRHALSIKAVYQEAMRLGTLYDRSHKVVTEVFNMAASHVEEMDELLNQRTVELVRYSTNDISENFGQDGIERMQGENESLEEYLSQQKDTVIQNYSAQLSRDCKEIKNLILKYRLRVQMLMDQRDYDVETAKRSAFYEFMEPEFEYRDSRNRKFKGEDFLYTVVNSYFLQVYNRTFIFFLARMGDNTFTVRHPDGKYSGNVYAILHFDGNTMRTYDEIEPEVFHPRSKSLVDYHDEAV